MLQNIRDKTQGLIATLIVGLVAFTFAIWGIHYYLQESKSSTVVVQVNGTKLTQDNFERLLKRSERLFSLSNPNVPISDAARKKLQKTVADQWLQMTLLSEAANHERFAVSAPMLRDTLANLAVFQEKGIFSPTLYQRTLEALGYTPQEFQQNLQNQLLIDQVRYGVVQSAFVLPNELTDAVATLYQTRDMGYVLIPAKSFVNSVILDPKVIQQYYASHQSDFMDPEKVKIAYIQIKPEDLKKQVSVSDAEVKAYYDGQSETKPFAAVKNSIATRLQNQAVDKLMGSLSDQLDSLAYEDPTSLQAVSQKLKLPIQVSDWFNAQTKQSIFEPAVIQAAFSKDVLQQGYNSALITLSDGSVMVLRIQAHQATQVKPLTAVQAQIQSLLKTQALEKSASAKAELILKGLEQGQDPKALAQKNGLVWQETQGVTRTSAGIDSDIIKLLFKTPLNSEGKQSVVDTSLKNGDAVVLRIQGVHVGDIARLSVQQKMQLQQEWGQTLGQTDYDLYERGLKDAAKIKMNLPKDVSQDE